MFPSIHENHLRSDHHQHHGGGTPRDLLEKSRVSLLPRISIIPPHPPTPYSDNCTNNSGAHTARDNRDRVHDILHRRAWKIVERDSKLRKNDLKRAYGGLQQLQLQQGEEESFCEPWCSPRSDRSALSFLSPRSLPPPPRPPHSDGPPETRRRIKSHSSSTSPRLHVSEIPPLMRDSYNHNDNDRDCSSDNDDGERDISSGGDNEQGRKASKTKKKSVVDLGLSVDELAYLRFLYGEDKCPTTTPFDRQIQQQRKSHHQHDVKVWRNFSLRNDRKWMEQQQQQQQQHSQRRRWSNDDTAFRSDMLYSVEYTSRQAPIEDYQNINDANADDDESTISIPADAESDCSNATRNESNDGEFGSPLSPSPTPPSRSALKKKQKKQQNNNGSNTSSNGVIFKRYRINMSTVEDPWRFAEAQQQLEQRASFENLLELDRDILDALNNAA